ncbi:MAG: site-specific integrase [Chloroflexi bacterium]|nr:site-specific integrase [Chloroflexota bacterium]
MSEIDQVERLRPNTVRAYRYELAAAAVDRRFRRSLDELRPDEIDDWLVRAPAATSTVGRRVATFRRFFCLGLPSWAVRAQSTCRTCTAPRQATTAASYSRAIRATRPRQRSVPWTNRIG